MSILSISRTDRFARRGVVLLAALLLFAVTTGSLAAADAGAERAPEGSALEEAVGGALSPCVVGVLAIIVGLADGDTALIATGSALATWGC